MMKSGICRKFSCRKTLSLEPLKPEGSQKPFNRKLPEFRIDLYVYVIDW